MKWISKIGLGSVQFGLPYGISNTTGQTTDSEVSKILDTAFRYQINTIDTAASYGTSESVLGKFARNRFEIVSKFMPSSFGDSIKKQFENSIEALQINKLYGYLAHRPLELIAEKQDWKTIQELKAAGKINKIGFSLNDPKEYFLLLDAGIVPDIVQVPFNYFDNRFTAVLKELHANGCEVHTRSTFLQGLFFKKTTELDGFFDEVKPTIALLQNTYGENLQGVLLHYVLQQEFIDKVIMGVETKNQLMNNLLSTDDVRELEPQANIFSDQILMPSNWPKIKTNE